MTDDSWFKRTFDAGTRRLEQKAVPPSRDPCLVNLVAGELTSGPRERDWREARRCPFGCGKVCKGLR